jgi:dipeptidyl-peptidase-4
VEQELGSLAASDGQTLYYRLLKPAHLAAGRRYPVIVDTYGGPGFQYVRKDWMGGSRALQGLFHQVLAQHGFVVFTLDNRGSGSRGERFESAIAGRLGQVEMADQLRGVEFLKSQPFVDAARIGMLGWSYGGYMSAWIISHSHRFGAAVIGAPVTDLANLAVTTDIPGFLPDYFDAEFWQAPEAYAARSPLLAAGDVTTPALVLHGEADRRVPMAQGLALYRALQRQGLDVRMVSYPRAGHVLSEPAQLLHAARETLAWFERHVPVR